MKCIIVALPILVMLTFNLFVAVPICLLGEYFKDWVEALSDWSKK